MKQQMRSLEVAAGLAFLYLFLSAAPARPAVEIVSINADGSECVQAQVNATGEILGGEVTVNGVVLLDRITFHVLNTSCSLSGDGATTYEFLLNGVSLGTFPSDTTLSCSCAGPPGGEMTYTITEPGLLGAWDRDTNTLQFRTAGGSDNFISYVRAEIESGGQTETICLGDFNGATAPISTLNLGV